MNREIAEAACSTAGMHAGRISFSLALLLLALCACKREVAVEVPASLPAQPRAGQASFHFLVEPPQSTEESGDWEYISPRPIGRLALPEYPAQALKLSVDSASVTVRIVIGAEGTVTEITESPGSGQFTGLFAADFRRAVEAAVRSWRFMPAEYRWLEDGKDLDGDGKPDFRRVVAREKVAVYYDVRFDFEIVEGEGRVRPK